MNCSAVPGFATAPSDSCQTAAAAPVDPAAAAVPAADSAPPAVAAPTVPSADQPPRAVPAADSARSFATPCQARGAATSQSDLYRKQYSYSAAAAPSANPAAASGKLRPCLSSGPPPRPWPGARADISR